MLSQMDYLTLIMSVFAGSSVVIMTGMSLYFKIRRKYPINVNCWFCNSNTKVPYESKNCWECPSCEQYNGFSPDGAYNKAIPAQHNESLNNSVTPREDKKLPKKTNNGLCWKCNCNQELKIYQLASFSPINPARYDQEIESFRKRLEKEYKLCDLCEGELARTLNNQKDWILSLNLEYLRQKKISLKKNLVPRMKYGYRWFTRFGPGIARNLLVLLSGWISLAHCVQLANGASPYVSYALSLLPPSYLPLLPLALKWEVVLTGAAMFIHVFAGLLSRRKISKKQGSKISFIVDTICCILWLLQQTISWLSQPDTLELMTKQLNVTWVETLDFGSCLVVVSYLTLFSQAIAALAPRPNSLVNKSPKGNYSFSRLNIKRKPMRTYSDDFSDGEDTVIHNGTLTENRKQEKPSSPLQHFAEVLKPSKVSSFPLGDEDELDIGNLSLGPIKVANDLKAGRQSSPSFIGRTKPVIHPARLNLKNIVQSSWVAGGYWQAPNSNQYQFSVPPQNYQMPSQHAPNTFFPYNSSHLSRSSSQSSGFVSQSGTGSNIPLHTSSSLPGSTSSSTCGDQESGSVFSEPVYHKHPTVPYYGNIFSGNHPPSSFSYPQGHPLYGMVSAPLPIFPHYPAYYRREPLLNVSHCCCCQALPPKSNPNFNMKSTVEDSDSHSSSSGFSETLSALKSSKINQGSTYKVSNGKINEGKSRVRQPAAAVWAVLRENVFLLIICGSSLMFNALMLYLIFMGKGTWLFVS